MTDQATIVPPARLLEVWQQHTLAEFVHRDTEAALATMTDDAYVLNAPIGVGGRGKAGVRAFYGEVFLPQLPPDIAVAAISQTIGQDHLVEEAVYSFTHANAMDWLLPGVAPTGRRVEFSVVALVKFRGDKIASEHLHWDHASLLVQVGQLERRERVLLGAESAHRLLEWSGVAAPPR